MDAYMQVITERMKDLFEKLSTTSQQVEENCSIALQSLEDLSYIFAAMSKWSIVSVQQRVQEHLKTGRNALEQSIKEYENANAEVINIIEKDGVKSVTIKSGNESIEYTITNEELRKQLNSLPIPKQPQIRECDGNGKPIIGIDKNGKEVDVAGRCNVSSLTMLLNRKYALDTNTEGSKWFTPQNVLEGNGCTIIKDWGTDHTIKSGQQFIQYEGGTGNWYNGKTYSNGELSYKTVACSSSSVQNEVSSNFNGSYEEYIASMLEKHPEGICLRSASKNHVVTITDYSRDQNGNVHLYCDDPVDIVSGKSHLELKDAHVWTDNNFWGGLDRNCAITYLEPC